MKNPLRTLFATPDQPWIKFVWPAALAAAVCLYLVISAWQPGKVGDPSSRGGKMREYGDACPTSREEAAWIDGLLRRRRDALAVMARDGGQPDEDALPSLLGVSPGVVRHCLLNMGYPAKLTDKWPDKLWGLLFEYGLLMEEMGLLRMCDARAEQFCRMAEDRALQGDLAGAAVLLAQAEEWDLAAARKPGAKAHVLETRAGRVRATRGRIANIRCDYEQAGQLYREAALLVNQNDRGHFRFLIDEAENIISDDVKHGEFDDLAFYRGILAELPRDRQPLARVQVRYMMCVRLLDRSENDFGPTGRAYLEEAVSICRSSLDMGLRRDDPVLWADVQSILGDALMKLGEREPGARRLEQATEAFRQCVKIFAEIDDKTKDPWSWALFQDDLGDALIAWGEREQGTARLHEAVGIFKGVVKELQPHGQNRASLNARRKMARALRIIGERESSPARLEEAAAAYEAALEGMSREKYPEKWPEVRHELGRTLCLLGRTETGVQHLKQAIAIHWSSLDGRDPDRNPVYWARDQIGLGDALYEMASRTKDPEPYQQAVAAFESVLSRRPYPGGPFSRATVQSKLGRAKKALTGESGGGG